jgi:hypothetical protein
LVYIITSGIYSDYGIRAVTLDRDKAELLKKMYMAKGYWGVEIEEWEEDDTGDVFTPKEIATEPIEYYHVQISKTRPNYNFARKEYRFEHKPPFGNFAVRDLYEKDVNTYLVDVEAKDKEHAKKIAEDMYAQALAEYYNLT